MEELNIPPKATWGQIAGKPELPEGISLGEYQGMVLEAINERARLRYANSLAQENYDDVLFDVFIDTSKIASSTNIAVTTGQNGDIQLNENVDRPPIPSSFDTTNSYIYDWGYRVVPQSDLIGIRFKINSNVSPTKAYIVDSTGTVLASKSSGVSSGQTVSFDYPLTAGNTYFIMVDDNGQSYSMNFDTTSAKNWPYTEGNLKVEMSGHSAIGNGTGWSSNNNFLAYEWIEGLNYPLSGSVTSIQKSLGYTPSKVTVQMDADIPADEDINVTISDDSGNSVTVTQADVGTDVDVSSFSTGNVTVDVNLSTSDGADTPVLNEYGVMFV